VKFPALALCVTVNIGFNYGWGEISSFRNEEDEINRYRSSLLGPETGMVRSIRIGIFTDS
jgi:hypothetical protein